MLHGSTEVDAAATGGPTTSTGTPAVSWAAELRFGRLVQVAAIAMQVAALVAVLRLWNVETRAFETVAMLVLAAFLPHHFLPPRLRLPVFALLSTASVVIVLGAGPGGAILAIGALLVGLAHLPIPFAARIAAILIVAALLAVLRAEPAWLPAPIAALLPRSIWPILGSMFMFRLVLYLYDLRHRAAPFGIARAGSYFFMLPNVCCPLFPVVDYQTMTRNHYNDDAVRIYQLGTKWMLRGIVQLLLYRFVYMRCMISVNDVHDALDVGQYMLSTFLLYLKISGLFHLIIGMLHLFGFNLPETHHNYLLSSSFTDFWRRINIYWKDFITKIVFYPLYFRWRAGGDARAVVLATLGAFVATWLLHSYQWFWIRGTFPIVWSDLVFWLGLGAIVVLNLRWEQRRGRTRRLKKKQQTPREALQMVLQTAGTFTAICILWTIWSTPSLDEMGVLLRALGRITLPQAAVIVAVPLAIGLTALVLGRRTREHTEGTRSQAVQAGERLWPSALRTGAVTAALLLVAVQPWVLGGRPEVVSIVRDLRSRGLNTADTQALHRGYYEELGDVTRFDNELWQLYGLEPKNWGNEMPIHEDRADARVYGHIPNLQAMHKNKTYTTNSDGMRDREYTKAKPLGTFRIAITGASHDVGSGVADGECYESILEEGLNARWGGTERRYEVLNFSTNGYVPIQKLASIESWMPAYSPDVIIYAASRHELDWTFMKLEALLQRGLVQDYPFFVEALQSAGIDLAAPPPQLALERELAPQARAVLERILARFAADARAHGARPVFVLIQLPMDETRPSNFDDLTAIATGAGVEVVDLFGAFAAVSDRSTLAVATWDDHTNALGHRLLGEKLLATLVERGIVPTGGTPAAARPGN